MAIKDKNYSVCMVIILLLFFYELYGQLQTQLETEKEINVCIQPVSFLGSNIYNAQL